MKKLLITLLVLGLGCSSISLALPKSHTFSIKKPAPATANRPDFSELKEKLEEIKQKKLEKDILKFIAICGPRQLDKSECVDVFAKIKSTLPDRPMTFDKSLIRQFVIEHCETPRTSIPDGGATLALLGIALLGIVATQRLSRTRA